MKYENCRVDWCKTLKDEVRYFREMIKHTASENAVPFLSQTRKRLSEAVGELYDPDSPDSVIGWANRLRQQVEAAQNDLAEAIRSSGRNVPNTLATYKHAVNLAAKIGGKIRRFEKSLTERV